MFQRSPAKAWSRLDDTGRFMRIGTLIPKGFTFKRFEGRSKVILATREDMPMTTVERGSALLKFERDARRTVDQSIQVFLAPQGDLNKLRLITRGVKV
jgi:hypothetical protein